MITTLNTRVEILLNSKLVQIWEQIYVVVSLLLFTRPVFWLLEEYGKVSYSFANTVDRGMTIAIYIIAMLLGFRFWKTYLKIVRANPAVLLLLLVITLSTLWSEEPGVTLRRLITVWLGTGFGLYIGIRFSLKTQLRLMSYMFIPLVVATYLAVMVFPDYAIMTGANAGAWRGVFLHKNYLGAVSSLGCLVFVMLALDTEIRLLRWGYWAMVALLSLQILFASSRGAYVITLIGISALFTVQFIWDRQRIQLSSKTIAWVVLGACAVAGATLIIPDDEPESPPQARTSSTNIIRHYDLSTEELKTFQTELAAQGVEIIIEPEEDRWIIVALPDDGSGEHALETAIDNHAPAIIPIPANKNTSVSRALNDLSTGRLFLWLELADQIKKKPWLGFGYDSYWERDFPLLWKENQWAVEHGAHNAYIEYVLDVGVVGLVLIGVSFLSVLIRAYRLLPAIPRSVLVAWPFVWMCWLVTYSFLESRFSNANNLFWPLFIAVLTSVTKPQDYAE